jgi:hypothetical protein
MKRSSIQVYPTKIDAQSQQQEQEHSLVFHHLHWKTIAEWIQIASLALAYIIIGVKDLLADYVQCLLSRIHRRGNTQQTTQQAKGTRTSYSAALTGQDRSIHHQPDAAKVQAACHCWDQRQEKHAGVRVCITPKANNHRPSSMMAGGARESTPRLRSLPMLALKRRYRKDQKDKAKKTKPSS